MIGCTAHLLGRAVCAVADTEVWFYVGGAVSILGPLATPILKSMISKLVEPTERGKVFVFFSIFNNAGSFIGGVAFARVYMAAVGEPWIFWMTAGTQLIVLVLI